MPLNDGRADLVRRLVVHRGAASRSSTSGSCGSATARSSRGCGTSPTTTGTTRSSAIAGPDSLLLRGDRLPTAGGPPARRPVHAAGGRVGRAGAHLDAVLGPRAAPPDHRGPDRLHPDRRGACGPRAASTRLLPRGRRPLAARPAPAHRRGDRRHRRGRHDVPAGGLRRRAQLGLPLCWLRDAAMTLEALLEHGYREEATGGATGCCAPSRATPVGPADHVPGRRRAATCPSGSSTTWPGYAGSRPVRVGNAAVGQVQNDVLGEVMCALELARDGRAARRRDDSLVAAAAPRRRPARSAGATRTAASGRSAATPRHFTHSKVMAWAAVDRAVRAAEKHGLDAPVERWRAERDAIHADVLAHGLDAERQHVRAVVRRRAHGRVAAAARPGRASCRPTTRASVGTLAAIRADLEVAPGLLRRYPTRAHRRRRRRRRAPVPRLLVLARRRARPDRRRRGVDARSSTSSSASPTTSACWPSSTTRSVAGWRATSPQALSHLALVRAVHSHDLALERQAR